ADIGCVSVAAEPPGVAAAVEVDGPGEPVALFGAVSVGLVDRQALVARGRLAQAVATARDRVAARVADRRPGEKTLVDVLLGVLGDRPAQLMLDALARVDLDLVQRLLRTPLLR